jgi:uncharacterized protein (TIGR00304 family)
MQSSNLIDLLAWALIILGSILILSGIASMLMRSNIEGVEQKRESKGIILLGPIPIVWGYGKKTWILVAFVAVVLFLIMLSWIP